MCARCSGPSSSRLCWACYSEERQIQKLARRGRTCIQCGGPYLVDHPDRPSSHCSKKCYGLTLNTQVALSCKFCGKTFLCRAGGVLKTRFCSRRCVVGHQRANAKPLLTDGHKQDSRTLRSAWASQAWKCRKRDGYTCQHCKRKFEKGKGGLDAHHIVPWRLGGGDELSNLLSLCKRCHKRADQAIRAEEARNGVVRPPVVRVAPLPNHCKRGHEYTPANTVARSDGGRRCRLCRSEYETTYRQAYRANPANAWRFKVYWQRGNLKRRRNRAIAPQSVLF